MEDPGENIRQILKQVLDKDHVNRLGPTRHRTESVSNLFQHGTEILGSTTGWNCTRARNRCPQKTLNLAGPLSLQIEYGTAHRKYTYLCSEVSLNLVAFNEHTYLKKKENKRKIALI